MKKKFILFIMLLASSCAPLKEDPFTDPSSYDRYLIVTADDYGASKNINEGIRMAAENGVISAISAMTNFSESIPELISLSGKYPLIGIGVHLNITTGKPLSDPKLITTLINDQGNFYTISELLPRLQDISLNELKTELESQIKILAASGIHIDHLSNQHGIISAYKPFFKIIIELAIKYNLPVRSPEIASTKYPHVFPNSSMYKEGYKIFRSFAIAHPLKALACSKDFNIGSFTNKTLKLDIAQVTHPDLLIDYFYGNPTEKNLLYIIDNLPPGINEIVLHIGSQHREQEYPSGLNQEYFSIRELELLTIINCHFNDRLHQMNIRKINYSEMDKIAKSRISN